MTSLPSSRTEVANPLSAMELVEGGLCSPQCLVARDDVWGICQCRCEGTYHGILADVQVEAKKSTENVGSDRSAGCPEWCGACRRRGGMLNHRADIAELRMADGTEIQVTASRAQRDDGSWEDPEIVIEAGELSGPRAPSLSLTFGFSVSQAWDLAHLITLTGGGGGWLAEALRHASDLFGPTHESGLDWFLWDNGMRPRPPGDEFAEQAQGDTP